MPHYADIYLLCFAVNKYLHTVATGWIFISNEVQTTQLSPEKLRPALRFIQPPVQSIPMIFLVSECPRVRLTL